MSKWAGPQQNTYFHLKHFLKNIAAVLDIFRATVTDKYDSGFILKSPVIWQKARCGQKCRS